jgi:hypothetical protein
MRGMKLRAPVGHADERVRHGLLRKPNQKAGNADLRADVEKLGDDAFDEMSMREKISGGRVRRWALIAPVVRNNFRQMREADEKRNEEKDCSDKEVRHFDHVGFGGDVGLKLTCTHGRFLCGCVVNS